MQSSQLYFAPTCTLNCLVGYCEYQSHMKKEKHSSVDRRQIVDMIENSADTLLGLDWQLLVKNIAKTFQRLNRQIKELQTKVMNDLTESKLQYLLGTQEPSIIRSALEITDNAKDHIYARCCDINTIYISLMEKRQTLSYKALKDIEKQMADQIEKNLLSLANFQQELLEERKMQEIDFTSNLELPFKERILKKITVDLVPSQLPNARFDVHLRIYKILKKFQINSIHKIIFIGGDQTGVSECVMTDHPLIMQGQSIFITNCKVYLFKSTKQIQSNINSDIKKSDFPTFINSENNISMRKANDYKVKRKNFGHDATDKNHEKAKQLVKYSQNQGFAEKTIQFLSPDDNNVSFSGMVLDFDEDCSQFLRFWMADETGKVLVELPLYYSSKISQNSVIDIRFPNVRSKNNSFMVASGKETRVYESEKIFTVINTRRNFSDTKWYVSN